MAHRGPKAALDPSRAYAALWEEEPGGDGAPVPTAAIFLTNRECPFRCLMCDLWVHTLDAALPPGVIPGQIRRALAELPPARQVKLYNAGSFFDPLAIPPEDDEAIAGLLDGFERVIVESHPAFLSGAPGRRCAAFGDRLRGRLEVAIGLETVHEAVLARLNKGMTLDAFRRAARFLGDHAIGLRVFVLLNPPFLRGAEAVAWACRAVDEAAACGAAVCSIIPTRGGNGALEALGEAFEPPRLTAVEAVLEYAWSPRRAAPPSMRVIADVWDIERFFDCACSAARAARIRAMNLQQRVLPAVRCSECGNAFATSVPPHGPG